MENEEVIFSAKRRDAEAFYRSIGSVHCPHFGSAPVHFNADGFEHLLFKRRHEARTRKESAVRFRLMPLALSILKMTTTVQDVRDANEFVVKKSGHGHTQVMKSVRYYAFVAVRDDWRIKIVVRHVEGGNISFRSVIPLWRTEPDGRGGFKRILYSENPRE